jgi:hypothetical protein
MDITLKLPDELVERAQAAGILTGEQVAELIEAELDRRQRREQFYDDLETLRSLEPKITPEEIEAELKAFRQERAAARRSDN